jgi:hypothetical protein
LSCHLQTDAVNVFKRLAFRIRKAGILCFRERIRSESSLRIRIYVKTCQESFELLRTHVSTSTRSLRVSISKVVPEFPTMRGRQLKSFSQRGMFARKEELSGMLTLN